MEQIVPPGTAVRAVFDTHPSHELDALTFGAERALKAMVECQVEGLRFAAKRTHAYLEFMHDLCQCRGFDEVGKLQQDFIKEQLADYGEEAGRFAGTALQLATGGLGPLQALFYRQTRGNGAPR